MKTMDLYGYEAKQVTFGEVIRREVGYGFINAVYLGNKYIERDDWDSYKSYPVSRIVILPCCESYFIIGIDLEEEEEK